MSAGDNDIKHGEFYPIRSSHAAILRTHAFGVSATSNGVHFRRIFYEIGKNMASDVIGRNYFFAVFLSDVAREVDARPKRDDEPRPLRDSDVINFFYFRFCLS